MITHDDLRLLMRRMVSETIDGRELYGRMRLSAISNTALCSEMVAQGLAWRDGPWLILTGNGWHTVRDHWPVWVLETIDRLVAKIVETDGGDVKMDDVSIDAGFNLLVRDDARRAEIAWSIIAHCCMQCFDQVTRTMFDDGTSEGAFRLSMRGYDLAEWAAALAAPPWELQPITEEPTP